MSDEKHTPSASEEPDIGTSLRKARIQKGLSLEEVEQATKIRKRYLDGLEREDYDMLPAAVYVQGFLKTYANYLGLDGDAISQEFKRSQTPQEANAYSASGESDFDEPLINPGGVAGSRRRGISVGTIVTAVVALFVLFLVVGGLYLVGRGSQQASGTGPPQIEPAAQRGQTEGNGQASADDGPSGSSAETTREPALEPETTAGTVPESTANAGPETTPENTTEPAPPSDTLRVDIQVEDRPSWLEIQADGETAFVRVVEPGFSETFEARRRLKLTTGDAGAVSVSVNGQAIGVLGESGEVLTRKWTLKQES